MSEPDHWPPRSERYAGRAYLSRTMISAVFFRRFGPPKCFAPIARPSSNGMLKRGSSFSPNSVRDRW